LDDLGENCGNIRESGFGRRHTGSLRR
jgi:hypothetical protein